MLIIKIPFDPIIIQLGPIIISWHGFFMSAGMILAVYLCLQIKEKFNYNEDMVFNTALAAIPSGIIGARLLFVFEYWTFYAANPIKIFALQNGGISIWGGIIGGIIGGFLFAFFSKYPLLKGLDLAAFGLIFGQAIGRIGDMINGEHFGTSTQLPWGVIYTNQGSPAFLHSLANGAHHPATSYEFIADMWILLFMLLILFRCKRYCNGSFFVIYILLYSAMRFFVTNLRVDSAFFNDTGLRIPQMVSLSAMILVISLTLILYSLKKKRLFPRLFTRLEQ